MKLTKFICMLLTISSCSCEKSSKCDFKGSYQFKITAELSPKQDTFRVGDTITVISEFSHEVFERKTQTTYKLEDFNFYPRVAIGKLDTVPGFISTDGFSFIVDQKFYFEPITYSDGESEILTEYIYENDTYELRYQFVPMKPGLFGFSHSSSLSPQGEGQAFPGRCRGKTSEAYIVLNQGDANNISLAHQGLDTAAVNRLKEDPQQYHYDIGAYIFYVEE